VFQGTRNSSVDIAKGYNLDGRGSIPGWGKRFSSIPRSPDWLWKPASLLVNGYRNKEAGA
jgi:hypothetical protein